MDRFQHLSNLLSRYQEQIQGLENAILSAEAADRTRLKQQLQDLREELRPYEAEYERLSLPAPGQTSIPQTSIPQTSVPQTSLQTSLQTSVQTSISQPAPLLEPPTGSLPLDAAFYIVRDADSQALRLIRGQGITLSITGSRQVGKSSLLIRVCEAAKAIGKQVALLDLQSWDQQALQDAAVFYRRFCLQLTLELGLPNQVDAHWSTYGTAGQAYCCSLYLQDCLIAPLGQPVVVALDEVEMLIDSPFRSEFFGMLRNWHNARATKPAFRQMDLVLVSSTEPYQLIEDLNQSPFNVGEELKLQDFTPLEVMTLNQRYGNPLTREQLKQLWQLVGGHPYLTARGLYQVASQRISVEALLKTAAQDQGVFGSHLRHHRLRLEKRTELLAGMVLIAKGESQRVSKDVAMRLEAAGLVRWQRNWAIPRCGLYQLYFHSGTSVLRPDATLSQHNSAQDLEANVTSRRSQANAPKARTSRGTSPWISGSFYLVVAVVVMTLVAVIGANVPVYVLPIVVLAGLLTVIVVGSFQLRQDDRFTEANFLTLMQETLKRLPLIQQTRLPTAPTAHTEAKDDSDNQP